MSGAAHKQLYGRVVEIMRDSMRGLSSASDVKAAAKAIRCVVDQALGDAEQSWNTSNAWTIAHFPPELLVQVFSWLDIAGRARVTEVSRDWGAIALGDPSLWTQIKLRNDDDVHYFDDLFRRSGTLCLALDLDYQDPDVVARIIANNISRISSLTLSGICPTGLFHGPSATQLREFEHRTEVLSIPSSSWAPNLQRLSLSGFKVPLLGDDRPFRHLTHFYGSLMNSEARELFSHCPCLVLLHLTDIHEPSLHCLPRAPIPRSLSTLNLSGTANFRTYLRAYDGHGLQHIHIMSHTLSKEIVPLFFAGSALSWTYFSDVGRRRTELGDVKRTGLVLRNEAGAVLHIQHSPFSEHRIDWSWLSAQLHNLTSMTITPSNFEYHLGRTPGLYAPSLVTLEFIKCRSLPFDWRKDLPQFHAPNLRELVVAFRVGERPYDVPQLVKDLRVLLRDTLGLPTGSISRLTLRKLLAQDGDIAVLSQIAQEVITTDDPEDSSHSTSP